MARHQSTVDRRASARRSLSLKSLTPPAAESSARLLRAWRSGAVRDVRTAERLRDHAVGVDRSVARATTGTSAVARRRVAIGSERTMLHRSRRSAIDAATRQSVHTRATSRPWQHPYGRRPRSARSTTLAIATTSTARTSDVNAMRASRNSVSSARQSAHRATCAIDRRASARVESLVQQVGQSIAHFRVWTISHRDTPSRRASRCDSARELRPPSCRPVRQFPCTTTLVQLAA